jgi:hypothetical protein
VKDSIALAMLAREAEELGLGEDNKDGIGEFVFQDSGKGLLFLPFASWGYS